MSVSCRFGAGFLLDIHIFPRRREQWSGPHGPTRWVGEPYSP